MTAPAKNKLDPIRRREVLLFAVAGVTNAATYVGLSYAVLYAYPAKTLVATTVGYVGAVVVSFVMNAALTFERGHVRSLHQAAKFCALYLLGYVYNVSIIVVGTGLTNTSFAAGVAFVTVTWPILSFLAGKYLVFR